MNMPICMHCNQPFEAHTARPDGNRACADGNMFDFEIPLNPEVMKYVGENLDKSDKELTQGWIEHVRERNRREAEAAEALKRDGVKMRAKADSGETLSLFDALESIGATMDPMWQGEWSGPIMFRDPHGGARMILVEDADHTTFDAWYKAHPNFSGEELQDHAREALRRMCARPVSIEP